MDPSPPSSKQTTTGEHREEELRKGRLVWLAREEELRKGRLVLFALLTADSGLLMYLLRGDLVFVASVVVTYVAVGLLLGRRFRCWEPRTHGGRWWLDAIIWILLLSLGALQVSRVLQVSRLARAAATSTSAPMLVAAAGGAALVVGGGCAYLLHRRSWYKEQSHEAIFLPLRQHA